MKRVDTRLNRLEKMLKDLESTEENELIDISDRFYSALDAVYGPDLNEKDREPVLKTQQEIDRMNNLIEIIYGKE